MLYVRVLDGRGKTENFGRLGTSVLSSPVNKFKTKNMALM